MVDPEEEELKGKHFAIGFMSGLSKWLFPVLVCLIIVIAVRYFGGLWTDDTDLDGQHRSGMKLHTDYKTGVQYLSDGHSLVVRVDVNGQPLVKKNE